MTCRRDAELDCGVLVETRVVCPVRRSHTLPGNQTVNHEVTVTCYDTDGGNLSIVTSTDSPLEFPQQADRRTWRIDIPLIGHADYAVTLPMNEPIRNSGTHATGSVQTVRVRATVSMAGSHAQTKDIVLILRT